MKALTVAYEANWVLLTLIISGQWCRNKHIWNKAFKSGLSKFCGRQALKNLKGYGLL